MDKDLEKRVLDSLMERRVPRRKVLRMGLGLGVGAVGLATVAGQCTQGTTSTAPTATTAPAQTTAAPAQATTAPVEGTAGRIPAPKAADGKWVSNDAGSVSVTDYWAKYGKEPEGEWVVEKNGDIDWWKPKASKKYHLAMVIPHVRDPYWIAVAYGGWLACQELGVTMDLRPAGGYEKLEQQMADMDDLIARKVDGIVLAAVDFAGLGPVVTKAWNAGIPVANSLIYNENKWSPGVTVDDYQSGVEQAKLAAEKMPNAQVFMLNGPPGVEWGKLRAKGFIDTVPKVAPGIKILGERYHEMDRTIAQKLTEDALQTWPDMNLVYCTADFQGKGAIAALRAAGKKPGDVGVTGVAMDQESEGLLREGWFSWLVSESAGPEGRFGTWILVHLLQGDPVPQKIFVPLTVYTKDNIDQYKGKLEGIDYAPQGWSPPQTFEPKS
ncbi:MAG: sugar ABC transporter substrate-binding protein [Chloroflexi bacterium]|nr:sugar ABC transporter substrate-binding protein [Chloroflexota bacterium]